MVSGLCRSRWFISDHRRASLSLSSVPQESAQRRRACLDQGDLLCPRLFLLEATHAPGLAAAPRFHSSHRLHVRHPVPTVPSACPCVSFRAQVPPPGVALAGSTDLLPHVRPLGFGQSWPRGHCAPRQMVRVTLKVAYVCEVQGGTRLGIPPLTTGTFCLLPIETDTWRLLSHSPKHHVFPRFPGQESLTRLKCFHRKLSANLY